MAAAVLPASVNSVIDHFAPDDNDAASSKSNEWEDLGATKDDAPAEGDPDSMARATSPPPPSKPASTDERAAEAQLFEGATTETSATTSDPDAGTPPKSSLKTTSVDALPVVVGGAEEDVALPSSDLDGIQVNGSPDAVLQDEGTVSIPKIVRFPSEDEVIAEILPLHAQELAVAAVDVDQAPSEEKVEPAGVPLPVDDMPVGELEHPSVSEPLAELDGVTDDEDDIWEKEASAQLIVDQPTSEEESEEEDPNELRISQLEAENAQMHAVALSQRQELISLQNQLHSMKTQLASTEQRLLVVSADLASSRSFVSSEDADGAQLLQAFTDLLESIDDHVYLLLDEVGDAPEDSALTIEAARSCTSGPALRGMREFVYSALTHGMSLPDFIPLFVQALLVDILRVQIFKPFVPGLDPKACAALDACYTDICASEPQDRSARWRAITYSRVGGARNDEALATSISTLFFSALEAPLATLLPDCDPATISGLQQQFASPNLKLIRDALRLRDLCMKIYLSVDYTVTFPAPGVRIASNAAKIEEKLKRCPHALSVSHDAKGDGDICVVVLSPGLSASKNKQRGGSKDGEVERTTTLLRKPAIVVAKCQWAPAHPTL